jgi:hypothetical protein
LSLTDNLKNVAGSMQQGAKNATASLTQRLLRLVSGFFVGLVLALIVQEFTQSNTLMLLFCLSLFTFIIYKLLRPFTLLQVVIFDVICILIANSLRMYIAMAP